MIHSVSDIMNRHSSKAFNQVGYNIWSLNESVAKDVEKELYRKNLAKQKNRKRKRSAPQPIALIEPTRPICSPEQIERSLSRILHEIQEQQNTLKRNHNDIGLRNALGLGLGNGMEREAVGAVGAGGDSILNSFVSDINLPYLNSEENDFNYNVDDPFQFLQDPFDGIPLSDCIRKMKQKYGDEGFCFILQVLLFFILS